MAVDITQIPSKHEPDRTGSIRGILRSYPDATHIISEFIQNAEDAHFGKIQFEVSKDRLRITNDGDQFSNPDYDRLVIFAQGKWGEAEKIGKFGVGFISAYHLTDSPMVASNGVQLLIKPTGKTSKRKHPASDGKRGSTFTLPLRKRPTALSERLGVKEVTDESIKSFVGSFKEKFYRCVLFLGGERTIEGWEGSGKNRRLVCRCKREVLLREDRTLHESGVTVYEKVLIHTEWPHIKSGKMASEDNEWLVFTQDFEKEYVHTRGTKPPGRTKVSLAFKFRDRKPNEVGYLHAFLPTRIKTGLPFNLNADFAPRTGRDDIMEGESAEARWNEWLIDCLGRLSVGIVDQLKSEVGTPADFYDIVPVECAEDRPYLKRIVNTFVGGVKDKAIVHSSKNDWLTRHQAYRVDDQLRTIVERSDLKFVAKETQDSDKATNLFNKIELRWFQSKDLVTLLGRVPRHCPLKKAPRFVRNHRRIGTIYRYLVQHEYDGMWDNLKGVSLCLDQFDILHAFDCSNDRVYSTDAEMRRILAESPLPLVKETLWKNHRKFMGKLVAHFGMDDLIEYLDNMGDDCVGKKLKQSPTPIINSLPKVQRIYKYLKRQEVFKNSRHKGGALTGTPLCIAQDDTIHAFNEEPPAVYLASKELRTMLAESKLSFVKLELQQRHASLLTKAGVREFGVDDVLLFIQEHTQDGIPLKRAAAPLNTKDKLLKVYHHLRHASLSQERLETIKSTSLFLTSKGNLRPLIGSDQGALALRSERFSDPLNLDNLLDDSLSKHRKLRKWLKDCLNVRELALATYISNYLIPQYSAAAEDVKLELLRMLRGNLKTILRDKALQGLLRSTGLIQCQDGTYRCGPQMCFKSRSIDAAFKDSYYYSSQTYARGRKSRNRIKKEEWGDLFTMLGVRQIPDSEAVIRAAESLAQGELTKGDMQRAGRLLRFLSKHWQEYEKEHEELKELGYLDWLPAVGDWNQLYSPDALHMPQLKDLVGTQVTFLALSGIDERLAQFLGVHTKAETKDIVNHILALSERGEPANLAIYEELDSRRHSGAIQSLHHRDVVDVSGKGDFWNPDKLFLGECSADFGKYRMRLPDSLRRLGWLSEEIGVRPGPESKDHVELLVEISDRFSGQHLQPHEKSLVHRAYARLARNLEEITAEQLEVLRVSPVVLGSDGRLYEHAQIFINDYPDYAELELSEEPMFCVGDASAEEFLKHLPVARLSKVLYPSLISVENERVDERRTQLMREIWAEPILRVNFSLLNSGRDISSNRETLSSTEIHVAGQIRVQWFYKKGEKEIPGAVQEYGAFYNPPILYFTDGDDEYIRLQMAKELARILAPEADPRTLTLHYEAILSQSNSDSVNNFLRIHGYRSLPIDQDELAEEDTASGPTSSDEGKREDTPIALGQGGDESQLGTGSRQPISGPFEPGGKPGPRQIAYVDTSKLKVIQEGSATPDEAKPFSIGGTALKRKGYIAGGGGGGGMSFSDENTETEAVAFKLIEKYEGDSGWNTDDNDGRGFTGYDILAQRGKETKYIEVKSSRGWNCPDLSFPQLMAAKKKRQKYYLYRVFNLERSESPPVLYIIQDPWGYLDLDVSGYTTKGYRENPKGDIRKVVLQES